MPHAEAGPSAPSVSPPPVHAAICFSDATGDYYKHALVTAASILEHARAPLCLHVGCDANVGGAARDAFLAAGRRFGQTVRLHDIPAVPPEIEANVPPHLGRGTLFRCLLPELLDVPRALYLDCDIVCLRDVAEIFHGPRAVDLAEAFFAAVPMDDAQAKRHTRRLGMKGEVCYNTGVLLMNLERLRRRMPDYAARMFTIVRDHPRRIGDQGAHNILFETPPGSLAPSFVPLAESWNFRTEQKDNGLLPLAEYEGKVVHFAGEKPWRVFSPPALHYWKYRSLLFPEEDAFAAMAALRQYPHDEWFRLALRRPRVGAWLKRLTEIDRDGLPSFLRRRLYKVLGKH